MREETSRIATRKYETWRERLAVSRIEVLGTEAARWAMGLLSISGSSSMWVR